MSLANSDFQDKPSSKPKRILRLPEVVRRSGLPRTSLYREIAAGSFPRQISLTERSSGWLESEIEAWIDARVRARSA